MYNTNTHIIINECIITILILLLHLIQLNIIILNDNVNANNNACINVNIIINNISIGITCNNILNQYYFHHYQ